MQTLDEIAERTLDATGGSGRAPADLSLDEIAALVGVSRSTLIRRIGSRAALDAALRERGAAADRSTAADRAVHAAARLYAERGVGNVSLDDIAAAAACTAQAIYGQIGGRDALLLAVAERYSPMPAIASALAEPPADLAATVRLLYQRIMESVFGEPPVVLALIAEMLSRPRGALADYVMSSYVPRAARLLRGWLRPYTESGQIRALPQATLASLFVGPMVMVNLTRIVGNTPLTGPERDAVVTDLADAFVRAVTIV